MSNNEPIDWENLFKPEDFLSNKSKPYQFIDIDGIAQIASARFRELVNGHGKRVYGNVSEEFGALDFAEQPALDSTHTAILICEREIK